MAKYDCIIIGAGPAGLTAGIYASRSGLKTLILEKMGAGGQMVLTELIENYPGVEKIDPRELADIIKKQAQEFGVTIEDDEALSIAGEAGNFKINSSKIFDAKTLIIASGASPKKLGIDGEDKFTGRGVSYCATCDGHFFKDKEVCVIGGGNAAVEEALYLSKIVKKVNLIHRRNALRAVKTLQDKITANPKVNIIWDSVPVEIMGDKNVTGIKIKNVRDNKQNVINLSGVFIYVGLVPNTQAFKGLVNLDQDGFIITDEEMRTDQKGIFACGDCRKKTLRQVITACADGAVAASSASKFLTESV
jgi:thioredoxin reductase (NADPH)